MWPRHILELGKQFNLMIRLQSTLKPSLQDVLKTSWRCHEDVFAKRLEDVLITSWRRLGKMSWRRLENVLKTSWRRMAETNILVLIKMSWRHLEDVFWRRMTKANIFVLIKTSWRRPLKMKTKDVFKTSSSRRMFARYYSIDINESILSNRSVDFHLIIFVFP